MARVHVYTIDTNEKRAIGIDGLNLLRVPVIGDKLCIRQKEHGQEVTNVYKVVDVHLVDKGSAEGSAEGFADVVVAFISEYNAYMEYLRTHPLPNT